MSGPRKTYNNSTAQLLSLKPKNSYGSSTCTINPGDETPVRYSSVERKGTLAYFTDKVTMPGGNSGGSLGIKRKGKITGFTDEVEVPNEEKPVGRILNRR